MSRIFSWAIFYFVTGWQKKSFLNEATIIIVIMSSQNIELIAFWRNHYIVLGHITIHGNKPWEIHYFS